MYVLSQHNYLRPNKVPIVPNKPMAIPSEFVVTEPQPMTHEERVRRELRSLGVSTFGMMTKEGRYLHKIIHPNEHLGGVIYGRHVNGFVMMVATDRRVIFYDQKPVFVNEDDITYDVISGVSYGQVGYSSTVTLHTRIKDYAIRVRNQKCARQFVAYIESRALEHTDSLGHRK